MSKTITVRITQDGNQICALIGENLQEGIAGFGLTVENALNYLATDLCLYGPTNAELFDKYGKEES